MYPRWMYVNTWEKATYGWYKFYWLMCEGQLLYHFREWME